jgi:hypothetical protein
MSNNPYSAPAPLPDEPIAERVESRPLGITILAVLHATGAVLFTVLLIFLIMQLDTLGFDNVLTWFTLILGPLLAIVAIAVPIGLWQGKKWAWWLATYYYVQFAAGGVFVIGTVVIATIFLDRPITDHSIELLIKHGSNIAIFSLFSGYMLKRKVRRFFRFQRLTPVRAILVCLAATLIVGGLIGLAMFVAVFLGARMS